MISDSEIQKFKNLWIFKVFISIIPTPENFKMKKIQTLKNVDIKILKYFKQNVNINYDFPAFSNALVK